MNSGNMEKGELFLYQSEDQSLQIEVRVIGETIWLTQKQMAVLFGCSVDNVIWHLKNIYKDEELNEDIKKKLEHVREEIKKEMHNEDQEDEDGKENQESRESRSDKEDEEDNKNLED